MEDFTEMRRNLSKREVESASYKQQLEDARKSNDNNKFYTEDLMRFIKKLEEKVISQENEFVKEKEVLEYQFQVQKKETEKYILHVTKYTNEIEDRAIKFNTLNSEYEDLQKLYEIEKNLREKQQISIEELKQELILLLSDKDKIIRKH